MRAGARGARDASGGIDKHHVLSLVFAPRPARCPPDPSGLRPDWWTQTVGAAAVEVFTVKGRGAQWAPRCSRLCGTPSPGATMLRARAMAGRETGMRVCIGTGMTLRAAPRPPPARRQLGLGWVQGTTLGLGSWGLAMQGTTAPHAGATAGRHSEPPCPPCPLAAEGRGFA